VALLGSALFVTAASRADAQGAPPTPAGARARLTGKVVDAATSLPLVGANIFVLGTNITATTGADGRYTIASAPVGIYTVEAKRLGYGARRFENLRLRADSVLTVDFTLTNSPLILDQVTVSGTIEETSAAKSTITVAKLTTEELPVPARSSAVSAIAGKVAGVAITRPSGAPGAGVNILLRTPISGATEGGTAPGPLFVVDGVFLNATQQVSIQDIEGMDVQSIEVIKGAAAASLYGTRAAAGVIAITTNRGRNLALGTNQFTLRTEAGFDQFQTNLKKNQFHNFRQDAQGNWLDANGNIVPRAQRAVKQFGIMDAPYTSRTYDHAAEFFNPGRYNTQTATVQGNSAAVNYTLSYSRSDEPGVIDFNDGFIRQSARINVDSRVTEKLNVGVSLNHSRGRQENPAVTFNNFYRIDTDVNLRAPDPFPRSGFPYAIIPDSVTNYTNPLYSAFIADDFTRRSRTQANVNARFRPWEWLSVSGDFNYDRGDLYRETYTGRGTAIVSNSTIATSTGSLRVENDITDGLQSRLTATATKAIGGLTARFTQIGELQREVNPFNVVTGTDFTTENLKNLGQARTRNVTQSYTDRRIIGSVSTVNLSLNEKYIVDALVRREGNSLFGRANRWNTFGRASGAWVMSEEGWFPLEMFNLFKLRYSFGVTGVSPGFASQYEAMTTDATGAIRRSNLGNVNITPTFTREQELGLDMTINSRVSASVVYVDNRSADVFVNVPAPASSGYQLVTLNPSTLTGKVVELTLQGQILNNPRGLQWTALLTADRQQQLMERFGRTCFDDGLQYKCDGVPLSQMWGNRIVRNKANLPAVHANSLDQFDVNDEGFVVPVGTGNTYRDGIAKSLWGTNILIDGRSYRWGLPLPEIDPATGQLAYGKIGDSNPRFRFGLNNNLRFKNARLAFQLNGQVGGNTYANSNQTYYASGDHPDVNNAGKPDELKKPVAYYNAVSNNNNLYLANFVESATHLALDELLLGYTFDAKVAPWVGKLGLSRLQVDLVGRNLAIWTKYSGLNVRAGSPTERFDDATYPLTRTLSAAITMTF
jgi:TonB-linked SusC/RagA family outer membrane protein